MISIRQLQEKLPWIQKYHKDFNASSMNHKDFGHALMHIQKAAGKLAAIVDDAEHDGSEFKSEDVDPYIADLVICALRMANTCPGRVIDLEAAVIERLEKKNQMKLKFDTEQGKQSISQIMEEAIIEFRKIFVG